MRSDRGKQESEALGTPVNCTRDRIARRCAANNAVIDWSGARFTFVLWIIDTRRRFANDIRQVEIRRDCVIYRKVAL